MQPDQLEPSLTDLILNPKSNKISRPPNAFMLFARDHRKSLAIKYPAHSNKNISSLLGQCWKKVDQSTRTEYFKKAKILEELHKQKYPGYVYSPRIARLKKMAKKKQKTDKSEDNTTTEEVPVEPIEQNSMCIGGSEKSGEWNDIKSEKKQSSPGYVPNNPQYFPDPEQGPQPEQPCLAENNPPTAVSKVHACSCCPPPTWNASTAESTGVTCAGRCPDECGARSDMYEETYYPKMGQLELYDYGPWHQYPDYAYEAPASATWSTCSAGCQGECCAMHPNDEHRSYIHLSSSHHRDLKNTYYHYNSPTAYRNPPHPYGYGPYNHTPIPYMPRRHAPRPNSHASYFPRSMDWYHHQYQQPFINYYPKYPHAAQPTNVPPIQDAKCSSGCPTEIIYDYRTVHAEEIPDSCNAAQGPDYQYEDTTGQSGYLTEVAYDSRPVQVEEMADSYKAAQGPDRLYEDTTGQSGYITQDVYDSRPVQVEEMADSCNIEQTVNNQSQNEEQGNTESDENEIIDVVYIEDIVSEEVVESTSPELEHGALDV